MNAPFSFRRELHQAVLPAWTALRLYLAPFAFIQSCAALLVVGYYLWPAARPLYETISAWKAAGGLALSALATALAGAVLPEFAKQLTGRGGSWSSARFREMFFLGGYFGLSGVIVDLFYQFQSHVYGTGTDVATVVAKVAVDQFVYNPLFAAPLAISLFMWRECDYNLFRTFRAWNVEVYIRRVVPLLLPTWAYWIPMVVCVYTLPPPLQFPLFVTAVSAWSLIFVFVAERRTAA